MIQTMMRIRVLTPDDWPIWRDLRLAALAEAPDAFGSTLADWQDAPAGKWRERLSLPGSHNLAVIVDDRPAGMASGVPSDEDGVADVISMWVGPTARGRGAGDLLLTTIAAWARANGARELRLMVRCDNAKAIELYRRNGFKENDVVEDGEFGMTRPL
jgi:ribosomal protein S18 acetylase RimI-like enzyme